MQSIEVNMVTDLSTIMDTAVERVMANVDRQAIEIIRAKERFPDEQSAELARRTLEDELARDQFNEVHFVGSGSRFPFDLLDVRLGFQLKFIDAYLLAGHFIPNEAYFIYQKDNGLNKRDDI